MVHFRTPTVLTLHLTPALAEPDQLIHIRFGKSLLGPMQIQHVYPQPLQWQAGGNGPEMSFRISPTAPESAVDLAIEPGAVGIFTLRISAHGDPPLLEADQKAGS